MRSSVFVSVVAAVVLASHALGASLDWKPLFNGKNLEGWVKRGGKAEYKVEDSAIVGTTAPDTPNTFLCTDRDYQDFILEFEVKVDPKLNSGVQFRSASIPTFKNGRVHGYQVEIDPSERAFSGGLYDEAGRGWLADLRGKTEQQKAFRNGEWNHYRVEAIGERLKTWVNGLPIVEIDDKVSTTGFIALQVHATTSTTPINVSWRNVRIAEILNRHEVVAEPDPQMGDYKSTAGEGRPVAQVIALGRDSYRINLLKAFDTREPALVTMEGFVRDGKATFKSGNWTAELSRGVIKGGNSAGEPANFVLEKTTRLSPTLGARAPEGSIVLFDGKNMDKWLKQDGAPAEWTVTEDGAMEITNGKGSIVSKEKLGDCHLHVEFQTPFMPTARGQQRGNSGVYLQGAYEVQVLDSYGLSGEDNECGGIYKAGKPLVNMCAPPLQWQTYDIDFTAAKFDSSGNKSSSARVTVKHNGVVIHDNVELANATPGGVHKEEPKEPGGLFLQDHGNPVRFRNIWAQPATSTAKTAE